MDTRVQTPGFPAFIEKQTLHDQVANWIRDMIIEGHLEPGSRIDETSLVDQLGVSRTPFREALRTLAAEGLVVIRPSKGVVVRKLTPADVFSMLEVLAEIERLAGRLAIERAAQDDLAQLEALHVEMMAHYARRDRLPYYKLNQTFHTRISELSRNDTLQDVHANIQAKLKRIRFIGNQSEDRWAGAVADHGQMIEAIRARDGLRLGDVLAQHLMATWDRVKDSL